MKMDISELSIKYLTEYHPYWIYDIEGKTRNPNFDKNSSNILDLKKGNMYAINYFADLLVEHFDEKWKNCYCMEVPSHDPANTSNPMQEVIKKVCSSCILKDCSGSLIRHKKIDKLSTGGNRNIINHLDSINLSNKINVFGQSILLLDDVTTTGNSLLACSQILLNNGAKNVFPVALAQTVRTE